MFNFHWSRRSPGLVLSHRMGFEYNQGLRQLKHENFKVHSFHFRSGWKFIHRLTTIFFLTAMGIVDRAGIMVSCKS